MKRLVWLLIIVFGTALAQVSPVDLGSQNQKPCSCCEAPGACGMADCALPPSSAGPTLVAEQPAPIASTSVRQQAARFHHLASIFLFQGNATPCERISPTKLVTFAQAPLFKVYCSFQV
jgi:hypothetical protein